MTEKDIKDVIAETLTTNYEDFNVVDFPLNIFDYLPTHPNGELLIKAMGFNITYLLKGKTSDPTEWGNFALYEYQIRIDLILKEIRTQTEILDLTQNIINTLTGIEYDDLSGRLYLINCSEPDYDEERMFQFRTLMFTMPFFGTA